MSNVTTVGQARVPVETSPGSGAPTPPPAAPATRSNLGTDSVSTRPRGAVPATMPSTTNRQVNLASFFRGFRQGQTFEIGGKGFVGSGLVGGDGTMTTLNANRIQFEMNVRAPGTRRNETVIYERNGNDFVSRDGTRFSAEVSGDGRTLTLTNKSNSRQRVVFESVQPGTFHMTAYGFEHSGKTMTFASR